jgi:hypothetical protein
MISKDNLYPRMESNKDDIDVEEHRVLLMSRARNAGLLKLLAQLFLFSQVFSLPMACAAAPFPNKNADRTNLSFDRTILGSFKDPFDIEAYFMLLPENVLDMDTVRRKAFLKQPGIVVDLQNGYLGWSHEGDGGGDSLEITYWILKDKTRLIGVNRSSWGMCCPSSKLRFFTFNDHVWKEVTDRFLPRLVYSDFVDGRVVTVDDRNKVAPIHVTLPRSGTVITITPGAELQEGYKGKPESITCAKLELVWLNDRFSVEKN